MKFQCSRDKVEIELIVDCGGPFKRTIGYSGTIEAFDAWQFEKLQLGECVEIETRGGTIEYLCRDSDTGDDTK